MVMITLDTSSKALLSGVFLSVFTMLYLAWTIHERRKGAISPRWASTRAEVTAVRYAPSGTVEALTQTIEFTYTVQGKTYQAQEANSTLPVGIFDPRMWTRRYEPGSSITVFYDTRNPARATLERANTGTINSGLMIATSLALAVLSWTIFFSHLA